MKPTFRKQVIDVNGSLANKTITFEAFTPDMFDVKIQQSKASQLGKQDKPTSV